MAPNLEPEEHECETKGNVQGLVVIERPSIGLNDVRETTKEGRWKASLTLNFGRSTNSGFNIYWFDSCETLAEEEER